MEELSLHCLLQFKKPLAATMVIVIIVVALGNHPCTSIATKFAIVKAIESTMGFNLESKHLSKLRNLGTNLVVIVAKVTNKSEINFATKVVNFKEAAGNSIVIVVSIHITAVYINYHSIKITISTLVAVVNSYKDCYNPKKQILNCIIGKLHFLEVRKAPSSLVFQHTHSPLLKIPHFIRYLDYKPCVRGHLHFAFHFRLLDCIHN